MGASAISLRQWGRVSDGAGRLWSHAMRKLQARAATFDLLPQAGDPGGAELAHSGYGIEVEDAARNAIGGYTEHRSEAVRRLGDPIERLRLAIHLGIPTGPTTMRAASSTNSMPSPGPARASRC